MSRAASSPPRGGPVYLLIALLAASLAIAGWAMRGRIPFLHSVEGVVLDAQLRARGPLAPGQAPGLAILLVDDRSLAEIGSLPIERQLVARVVRQLDRDGARRIVFDMLFVEPARGGPAPDQTLADAMHDVGRVSLAYALPTDPGTGATESLSDPLLADAYQRYRNEALLSRLPYHPQRALAPIVPLAEVADGLGHVSVQPGVDGALRYDFPALAYADELLPSLAVTVAARVLGVPAEAIEARLGEAIQIGNHVLPLDALSRQWVNYYGPAGTFPTYSLADYLAGRLDPAMLRDRVVLIGGTALGSSDRNPSPFDPVLPGVERLATVIDNLLTQRWLERPAWAAPVELAAILGLPLLAVWLIARLPPPQAVLLVGLVGLGFLAASQTLFTVQRQFITLAFPLFALALTASLGLAWRARLDLVSRRLAEARLRASEQRYALSAAGANDGLWDWDIAAGTVYFSARARHLVDLADPVPDSQPSPDGGIEMKSLESILAKLGQVEREEFQRELDAHLAGQTQQFSRDMRFERAGETRWLLVRGVAVREGGRPVRMAGSLTDITEQKRLERQIAFDALHDRLTGLANRDLFRDRLGQWLTPRGDQATPPVVVIQLDVRGFAAINERHGQVAGNALLAGLADRLRPFEREGALVARLGGDQFALASLGPDDPTFANRLLSRLERPFTTDIGDLRVEFSLAQAHTDQGLAGADDLLNAAALALGSAKQQAPGQVVRFDPAEKHLHNTRLWLDQHIDLALAAGDQFQLHYQPFIRLADRTLVGFEALIRWQHPERGQIMPSDFIPHAEQSGRINAIGRWCLFEVARQLVAWDRLGFKGEIAVNLSGRQFTETDLEADAREVLRRLGDIAPHRYKFEVTESMAMANPERTTEILKRLSGMGFKIAIDDFGTGYSSLAYLYRFPFDMLKVDRSFVIRLGAGQEAQEIVRTIVGLGSALKKQVLAEGIEQETEAAQLQALGVHLGQGWLFSRALPADRATAFIAAHTQAAGVPAR